MKRKMALLAAVLTACSIKGEDEVSFSYETLEDIPEAYRGLYKQNALGKYDLSVKGAVSQDNVTRLQGSLEKERNDHKASKGRWASVAALGIEPDEIITRLDEYDVLKINNDPAKKDEVIDARIKAALNPVQRQLQEATTKLADYEKQNQQLIAERNRNIMEGAVRKLAADMQMVPSAIDDAVRYVRDTCQLTDEGAVVTKQLQGIDEYTPLDVLLKACVETRPHWFQSTQGGGGRGSNHNSATSNPWKKESFNMTEQAKIIAADPAKAESLAKLAGVPLYGLNN